MSLTTSIKAPGTPARAFFEAHFPTLASPRADLRLRVAGAATIEPSEREGYPWRTVGMAIDYILRFCFPASADLPRRWDDWTATPDHPFALMYDLVDPLCQPLVAERAAAGSHLPEPPWRQAVGPFFGELAAFLRRAAPHRRGLVPQDQELLCRFCFVLGLFEELHRSPPLWAGAPLFTLPPQATVADLLGLCPIGAAEDLGAMLQGFLRSQRPLLDGHAVLNPSFEGSALIGGADGDLIVDGCYIDIKATRQPKRPSPDQWPWELLGYALLDFEDRHRIRSVGLYLARQELLVTWAIEEFMVSLVSPGSKVPALHEARDRFHQHLLDAATSRKSKIHRS